MKKLFNLFSLIFIFTFIICYFNALHEDCLGIGDLNPDYTPTLPKVSRFIDDFAERMYEPSKKYGKTRYWLNRVQRNDNYGSIWIDGYIKSMNFEYTFINLKGKNSYGYRNDELVEAKVYFNNFEGAETFETLLMDSIRLFGTANKYNTDPELIYDYVWTTNKIVRKKRLMLRLSLIKMDTVPRISVGHYVMHNHGSVYTFYHGDGKIIYPKLDDLVYDYSEESKTAKGLSIKRIVITKNYTIVYFKFHDKYKTWGITLFPPSHNMSYCVHGKKSKRIYKLIDKEKFPKDWNTNYQIGKDEILNFNLIFERIDPSEMEIDIIEGIQGIDFKSNKMTPGHFYNLKLVH